MRLPNGYGSVYKLSGKRRKPFIAVITKCINVDLGKQIRVVLGYYAKREEGLKALSDYRTCPFDLEKKDYTFAECYEAFVREKYTNKGKQVNMRYKFGYKYCEPLWNIPVKDVKTAQLQVIIDGCGLAVPSKNIIKVCMNGVFRFALANDLVEKNYAELIIMPKETKSQIHKPFTDEELDLLWKNKNDPDVQMVLILIYTGMRPTELLKIENSNVHLEEKYMIGGIKTENGIERIIPIADKIMPIIKSLYNPEFKFLVTHSFGHPYTYQGWRPFWDNAMAKLKMNHLPHDGRHTCGTRLDNAGININITKNILGHGGGDVTTVYIHKNARQLIEAINKI